MKQTRRERERERERMDLEDSDLVVEKTRGSDDVVGGHGRELVVLEARVFYHCARHLILSFPKQKEKRGRERETETEDGFLLY